MTEEEWLRCEEPTRMLAERGIFRERQLILFGCACCHRHWHLFDNLCRDAVIAAEKFADGTCDGSELRAVRETVEESDPHINWEVDEPQPSPRWMAWLATVDADAAIEFERQHPLDSPFFVHMFTTLKNNLLESITLAVAVTGNSAARKTERVAQAVLLRDIIGNPFVPVNFSSEWRTDTALALAKRVYEGGEFSTMPILADALQDAGCDNDDILSHCRGEGPHVRGCWVVDLVLGKE